MKQKLPIALATVLACSLAHAEVPPAPNGIEFPAGYSDWRVISVSHRTDHKSMRVILGNDIAVDAARTGQTLPWPDGAVLGKVVWKEKPEESWPAAIAPNEFIHAEFMYKDSQKWQESDGWGYARWVGDSLEPYGKKGFEQECIACHAPVKQNDWIYTKPAKFPDQQ